MRQTYDIGNSEPYSWYHSFGHWDQKDNNGIQIPNGEYQIVIPNVALGKAGFLSLSQSPTIIIQ